MERKKERTNELATKVWGHGLEVLEPRHHTNIHTKPRCLTPASMTSAFLQGNVHGRGIPGAQGFTSLTHGREKQRRYPVSNKGNNEDCVLTPSCEWCHVCDRIHTSNWREPSSYMKLSLDWELIKFCLAYVDFKKGSQLQHSPWNLNEIEKQATGVFSLPLFS